MDPLGPIQEQSRPEQALAAGPDPLAELLAFELSGELDESSLDEIGAALVEAHPALLAAPAATFAFRLGAVTGIATRVMALFSEIEAAAAHDGHRLALLDPRPDVRSTLERAGLGHLIRA